jgi:hypothetical protein
MSSTGEKRSVSTDALETLGTIIGEGAGRDAIHLAVEPAVAAEFLSPGMHVGFVEDGVGVTGCKQFLGIVDPFLTNNVVKGERFWLVVYPRQITSLRHVWSHPAFPESGQAVDSPEKADSEAWLRHFCDTHDCPDYETVMSVISSEHGVQLGDPEYYGVTRLSEIDTMFGDEGRTFITFKGVDAHCDVPNEFWDHAEIVVGRKLAHRPSYFSCTC